MGVDLLSIVSHKAANCWRKEDGRRKLSLKVERDGEDSSLVGSPIRLCRGGKSKEGRKGDTMWGVRTAN